MPWRVTCPMDQRRKFVEEVLGGRAEMSAVCEGYGISRKTGYKWLARFAEGGSPALEDRSRAPLSHPNTTESELVERIIRLRARHPLWGPRKLKHCLGRKEADIQWPAPSTIGDILKRNGLISPRRRRRRQGAQLYEGQLTRGLVPNDVWFADFKGWFRTGDGTRVDPLTLSDGASRYLIRCKAVERTDGETVKKHYSTAFQKFGLPLAIRSDNGVPFAGPGLCGLSRLAVWLLKIGVRPERIRPGHPQDNGVHERMHRTLKDQTAKPPRATLRAQQKAFDDFQREFNEERPHEAIEMKTPGELYRPSNRPFPSKIREFEYDNDVIVRKVSENGTISWRRQFVYLGPAFAEEHVGLIEKEDGLMTVQLGEISLGQFNERAGHITKLIPLSVSPMCPV